MPMTTGDLNDAAKELLAYEGYSDINDDQAAFPLQEQALLRIFYEKPNQNQISTRFLNNEQSGSHFLRLLKKNNIPIQNPLLRFKKERNRNQLPR